VTALGRESRDCAGERVTWLRWGETIEESGGIVYGFSGTRSTTWEHDAIGDAFSDNEQRIMQVEEDASNVNDEKPLHSIFL
jgi:hypothetical protein